MLCWVVGLRGGSLAGKPPVAVRDVLLGWRFAWRFTGGQAASGSEGGKKIKE
jgi:hypothetical protein